MRPILLVGEQNPHGGDPDLALSPLPARGSGGRLAKILGLSVTEYLRRHDRVNLCRNAWDATEAIEGCRRIRAERPAGSGVVLCGSKAASAFGLPYTPHVTYRLSADLGGQRVLVLPHPSGLCRAWNDPAQVALARRAYGELASSWFPSENEG